MMNAKLLLSSAAVILLSASLSQAAKENVSDEVVAAQRAALAESTKGAGFGPQSPRDIDSVIGKNARAFSEAPDYAQMNLCNIHFHENAEHKGGEFTKYAGNGDGKGAGTGFVYNGDLTDAELAPYDGKVGVSKYGDLAPGDTIELHYVHTTTKIKPGPTLGACLSKSIVNPQLRVEARVFVIVNDDNAHDFKELTKVANVNGFYQAVNIPNETGSPVEYDGSTTGPSYNEVGSPLQVSWSVRPKVLKVSISSLDAWLKDNIFDETGAHGVRNLVINPDLLSQIDG